MEAMLGLNRILAPLDCGSERLQQADCRRSRFSPTGRTRPKADAHRNRLESIKGGKAAFQFRRKQSLNDSAKNLEAVGQTGMLVFLVGRLLSSGY